MKRAFKHLGNIAITAILAANIAFIIMLLGSAYSPWLHPTEHPVASCMGLAFPVFILANGCFLLFWLLIRCFKTALLPLAGYILCLPQLLLYIPVNPSSGKVPEDSFKLLSYNIMGFYGEDKDNAESIVDYLKASRADIICLQEYPADRTKQRDIENALKDYPYHRTDKVGTGGNNRIACYSKLPILRAKRLDYKSDYNGSIMYELAWGKDTLTLISNHLESNKLTIADKEIYEDMLKAPQQAKMKSGARLLIGKLAEASALRAPQADSIAKVIDQTKGRYTVVCGDFNDTPISYVHHTIGRNLNDAFGQSGCGLGISYNRNMFYFRIDHILTSKNLQTYRCTVDRSIKTSDHYPIWCHIARKK